MKLLIYMSLIGLISISCSKSDDKKAVTDPIYGKWVYETVGSDEAKAYGYGLIISPNNKIEIYQLYAQSDGSSSLAYFRKSIGTFERASAEFNIKYDYETCNPVINEKVFLNAREDRLILTNADKSVQLTFARASDESALSYSAAIEDKNCDILAKNKTKMDRVPASVNKSFITN